jgi:hypothetical protein
VKWRRRQVLHEPTALWAVAAVSLSDHAAVNSQQQKISVPASLLDLNKPSFHLMVQLGRQLSGESRSLWSSVLSISATSGD